MTNPPLSFIPGICKVNSTYADSVQGGDIYGRAAMGRFTDMNKVRFVAGFPEKLGGWTKATQTQMLGTPRGIKDWRDFSQNVYAGIGTSKKLYYYSESALNAINDITPLRAITTGTFTDKISTTNGSTSVNINHASHGQQVGDYVILTATSTVGGLTFAGVYWVATVVDANNYTITSSSAATSTVAASGGATAYTYYRITLTNPFDTVSGSASVTVNQTAHGAAPGDYVRFFGASAVGGLTIDGQYAIVNVSADSYTITASSSASGTASGGGTVTAIYDISVGLNDSAYAYGYGVGPYGGSGYGTTGSTGILLSARTWCLDRYGQQLLANPSGGTIYVYDPTIGGRAYPLYGAPAIVLGMFVTPERFVIALGVNSVPTKLAWPDQNDYTDWVSTALNTANEGRTLQNGNYLVNGMSIRSGLSIVFTNTNPYDFTYTGDDNIYASNPSGSKCGLVGPLGCTVLGDVGYWWGTNDLWMWDGSTTRLPTDDIRDYVFQDINLVQAAKFVCGSNTAKNEVFFAYCSSASSEIDRYVLYHVDMRCFSIGTLERTGWLDRELFAYPMATDASGYLYKHEYGVDADGSAMDSYITFSPMDIAKGQLIQDVTGFIPDFKRQTGAMTVTPLGRDRPMNSDTSYGPYDVTTTIVDIRLGDRMFGYTLESNVVGGDWRLGLPSVEVQPAGARR